MNKIIPLKTFIKAEYCKDILKTIMAHQLEMWLSYNGHDLSYALLLKIVFWFYALLLCQLLTLEYETVTWGQEGAFMETDHKAVLLREKGKDRNIIGGSQSIFSRSNVGLCYSTCGVVWFMDQQQSHQPGAGQKPESQAHPVWQLSLNFFFFLLEKLCSRGPASAHTWWAGVVGGGAERKMKL